ncbi:MAG: IclR family transcriptional regulator [Meiothermus silvanus]|nr:IclR family transcriptional regulator [Allomeiothermus silvanus]
MFYSVEQPVHQSGDNPGALDKLLITLLAFEQQPCWRLSDLARALKIPKGTMHRLLLKLVSYGFLYRQPATEAYCLGSRIRVLAARGWPFQFLSDFAHPYLEQLALTTGETAFLTVVEGFYCLCVGRVEGNQPLRLTMTVGEKSPLHLGASNQIMLAYLPESTQAEILRYWIPEESRRLEMQETLKSIRKNGHIYTAGQLTPGVAALGVPVLDEAHNLLAGLSLAGPADRFSIEVAYKTLPLQQQAASAIARELKRLSPQSNGQR